MQLSINSLIVVEYEKAHKNYDYALDTLLNSIDPEHYLDVFNLVTKFIIKDGETSKIELGNDILERIKSDFKIDNVEQKTLDLLLWVALLFPEV